MGREGKHRRYMPTRAGTVRPVRIDPAGVSGPTPNGARGPRWRASSRGLYVPGTVELTLEQRIVEAEAVLPGFGGVTGWAALSWAGARWFDGIGVTGLARPVWLATSCGHIRPQPGIAISKERLKQGELVEVDGIWITIPTRSVGFEARYAETDWRAVQAIDMAAYADLVSIAEMADVTYAQSGWTGVPRCRLAVGQAVENSWSPQETVVRLVWVGYCELPPLLCNHPVFDRRGNFIGTPDLLDAEAGVAIDYHGEAHLERGQSAHDVNREERFRRNGLEYVAVLAPHLSDISTLAGRLHAARARGGFKAESTRGWSVKLPPWWVPTFTVEQRRNLTAAERTRYLRYRAA